MSPQRLNDLIAKARSLPLPRESSFTSRLRSPAVAARVGVWLGICFVLAFITGWLSHEAQDPNAWLALPTRPVWLYRATQGIHVLAGTAAIPLLLVKLWSVFPKLFASPPRRLRLVLIEILERGSVAVLVSSAIFQLTTGLLNAAAWYPWHFHFRGTHYALAWICVGALLVHVAIKLPIIRDALAADIDSALLDRDSIGGVPPLSRRTLTRSALLAAGVAVVATAGNTVPALRRVSVFAVRSGEGPQGIPINKTARAAGVVSLAQADDFALGITYGGRELSLTRDDLLAFTQRTHALPIACVEGWSAQGRWTGVRLRDLLDAVGAPRGRSVMVDSLQTEGPFRQTLLPAAFADDDLTLLALALNGTELTLDHGYPCRLIAPNRPGVLQTKWVSRLEVLA